MVSEYDADGMPEIRPPSLPSFARPDVADDLVRTIEESRQRKFRQEAEEHDALVTVGRYAAEQHAENQQLRILTAVLSIAVIADLLIVAQTSDLGFWRITGTAVGAAVLYVVLRSAPGRFAASNAWIQQRRTGK